MRGPGSTTLLGRALITSAAIAGAPVQIISDEEVAWHSATFTGARHAFDMRATNGDCAVAWLDTVAGLNLPLTGHLIADLSVSRRSLRDADLDFRIEALTVAIEVME